MSENSPQSGSGSMAIMKALIVVVAMAAWPLFWSHVFGFDADPVPVPANLGEGLVQAMQGVFMLAPLLLGIFLLLGIIASSAGEKPEPPA